LLKSLAEDCGIIAYQRRARFDRRPRKVAPFKLDQAALVTRGYRKRCGVNLRARVKAHLIKELTKDGVSIGRRTGTFSDTSPPPRSKEIIKLPYLHKEKEYAVSVG